MAESPDLRQEDFQDGLPSDRKRKRDEEKTGAKSSKRKKRARRKITDEDNFDEQQGLNLAIAQMDSQLLVDHIAKQTKKFEPNMPALEMEDRYIPARAVLDTTSWDRTRTTECLPAFLEHFGGEDLSTAPGDKGSPHTLVVAGAALRAADLTRTLRKFQTEDVLVAKLFAKHIKLKEAVESCTKHRYVVFLRRDLCRLTRRSGSTSALGRLNASMTCSMRVHCRQSTCGESLLMLPTSTKRNAASWTCERHNCRSSSCCCGANFRRDMKPRARGFNCCSIRVDVRSARSRRKSQTTRFMRA